MMTEQITAQDARGHTNPSDSLRILITTQPGYGHFGPLAPLGRALIAAGHKVQVGTARSFAATVAGFGLDPVAAGMDWLLSAEDAAFPMLKTLRTTDPESINDWAARNMFRGQTAEPMAADLLRLARSWSPDVIIREPLEFGGRVAAEVLGVPHVVAGPIWFRPSEWEASVGDRLEALRHQYGLAPDPAATRIYGDLVWATMPPVWVAPDEPLPSSVRFVRPEPVHTSAVIPDDLEQWLAVWSTRPLVLVSLGTVFNRLPEFACILEALRNEEVALLVTVGGNVDPAALGPTPSHIRVERYVPHEALLPRCDLLVVHGGFSSLMAAFRAGTPVVVLPMGGDQPRNARRCVELGVGLEVGPDRATPDAIRAAVRAVISATDYRAAGHTLQAQLAALPIPRATDISDLISARR